MKKQILRHLMPLFFTGFCLCALSLEAQDLNPNSHFPSFSAIKQHLEKTYTIPMLSDPTASYGLMKNSKGVYLTEETFDYERQMRFVSKKYLVWAAATKNFTNLRFAAASPKAAQPLNLSQVDSFHFDLLPFFGYIGWQKDIINTLQPWAAQNRLSAPLWYAYGRAHAELSKDMVLLKREYGDTSVYFRPSPSQPALSASQAALYRQTAAEAIRSYEQCAAADPNFRTIVGNIRMKYWNEVVDAYLTLDIFGAPTEADKVLKNDLYDAFWAEFAENVLLNAPQNAVIITYGDTDTYVLLYFQKIKKWRPDVVILSESLLNLPEYIHYATTKGVKLSLPLSFYAQTNSSFIRIENVEDATENLHMGPALRKMMANVDNRIALPDKSIAWPLSSGDLILTFKQYLTRAQIVVLDLLYSAPMRPLAFTAMADVSSFQHFTPYMLSKGFLLVMTQKVQKDAPVNSTFDMACDKAEMRDLLFKKYHFDDKTFIDNDKKMVVLDYIRQFFLLAAQEMDTQPEAAKSTLNHFSTIFDEKRWPLSRDHLSLAIAQCAIGDKAAAQTLVQKLWKKMTLEKDTEALRQIERLAQYYELSLPKK